MMRGALGWASYTPHPPVLPAGSALLTPWTTAPPNPLCLEQPLGSAVTWQFSCVSMCPDPGPERPPAAPSPTPHTAGSVHCARVYPR